MSQQAFFTVLVLLACCGALIQGLPTSIRDRCFCRKSGMLSVNMERVVKVEYHKSTTSCGHEELLVLLKNNRRRCLNLNGDQGRRIKQEEDSLLIQDAPSDDEDQMTAKKYIPSIPPP